MTLVAFIRKILNSIYKSNAFSISNFFSQLLTHFECYMFLKNINS